MISTTLGMATYDDFAGVESTVMHIATMDEEIARQCELIVVDNNPGSKEGEATKNFVLSLRDFRAVQYVPFTDIIGTAAPRDEVFMRSTSDLTVCMDSHITTQRGCLQSVVDYFDDGQDAAVRVRRAFDMVCGPIVYYDRRTISTHFEDIFRHGMRGVWATDNRGFGTEPFEVPGQGLGFFAMLTEVWKEIGGFNRLMNGFGAEELYIHEKVRRHGGRVMCIPQARWVHRFNHGAKYPRTNIQKVRNYVIGHRELGLPLDRIKAHFVDGINEDGSSWNNDGSQPNGVDIRKANTITLEQWNALAAGEAIPQVETVISIANQPLSACDRCGHRAAKTLEELYDHVAKTPHDINEHVPLLRELAGLCDHVTEWGKRHNVSTTALLMGQPKKLVSYAETRYPEASGFETRLKENCDYQFKIGSSVDTEIEETDMLFLDTVHTKARLLTELNLHHTKVRKFIAMHDTAPQPFPGFGTTGEDGGPGLLAAIREFVKEHPEWTVWKMRNNNYGFTVLSKRPEDKRPLPNIAYMAWNYTKAMARNVAKGGKRVSEEVQKARLDQCLLCPLLTNGACSICGCPVEDRTLIPELGCPNEIDPKWAPVDVK